MKNPDWILGLDFETTGLEPENDKDVIIEVGAVLWEWSTATPLAMLSETIILEAPRTLSDEIIELTGITPQMVQEPLGKPESVVLVELARLAGLAGYYMAHNAPFDRSFAVAGFERNFLEIPDRPWIDTITDLPYPPKVKARALGYVAADHGFLNPFAHRAVFDVLTMLTVAARYPLETILELQNSPVVRLKGNFPMARNDEGKAAGFRWEPQRKYWYRDVKACLIKSLKIDVPYTYDWVE